MRFLVFSTFVYNPTATLLLLPLLLLFYISYKFWHTRIKSAVNYASFNAIVSHCSETKPFSHFLAKASSSFTLNKQRSTNIPSVICVARMRDCYLRVIHLPHCPKRHSKARNSRKVDSIRHTDTHIYSYK